MGKGRRGWVFTLLGIISSIAVLFAYWARPQFLVSTDLKAVDAMMSARGVAPAPPEVVIVAVDERSVNELGRWPWGRGRTADLVRKLSSAKVVALDMVFSEPTGAWDDEELSRAIRESGNVVTGFFFRDESTGAPDPGAIEDLRRSMVSIVSYEEGLRSEAAALPIIGFPSAETNIGLISSGSAGFGSFNIIPEEDGLYRVYHAVYGYGGGLYPSLALESLRRFFGGNIMVNAASYGVDSVSIDGRTIPVDEEGGFSINFYGPSGAFRTYPAVDVIEGRAPPDAFAGKLVFVGVTEKGVYDIRPTPLDPVFPGVEIHATVAANVLEERYLIRDTRVVGYDLLMVVALPLVLALTLSRVRATYQSLAFFIILFVTFLAWDFFLFAAYSLRIAPLYPALSLLTAYISCEAYRNIVVEKRSRYLRKAFSSYVSTQLVNEILKDPGSLKLGGEKRVVTILFSDIRGFTAISERLAPEDLVSFLNEYLSPMTRIVLEEGGMLDKYIGDAIMAVFNSPVEVPDHPARACRTALRMAGKLRELNSVWAGRGLPAIEVGIGISTGEAVVGNMGAELRFDYTAIGDTVNLASRLEGMNKLYGTGIIVSESTKASAPGFLLRELDLLRVKGKEKHIAVYELMAAPGCSTAGDVKLAEAFAEGVSLYRKRRFSEAKEVFDGLVREKGDPPSALYSKRCEEFMKEPPPDGWDGVYTARTK